MVPRSPQWAAVATGVKPSGHASGVTISSLGCNEGAGTSGSAEKGHCMNQAERRTKTEDTHETEMRQQRTHQAQMPALKRGAERRASPGRAAFVADGLRISIFSRTFCFVWGGVPRQKNKQKSIIDKNIFTNREGPPRLGRTPAPHCGLDGRTVGWSLGSRGGWIAPTRIVCRVLLAPINLLRC